MEKDGENPEEEVKVVDSNVPQNNLSKIHDDISFMISESTFQISRNTMTMDISHAPIKRKDLRYKD